MRDRWFHDIFGSGCCWQRGPLGGVRMGRARAIRGSVGEAERTERLNDLLGGSLLGTEVVEPGTLETITPAERMSSLSRRSDAGDEDATWRDTVKSRVVKLVLTLGTLATALLAGAASLRVG